jgi:hypothetical protein
VRRLAALAMASALVLLPAASARAETRTDRDARHDVVRVAKRHPAQETPAPHVAFLDLTGDRISYGRHRVVISAHARRLDRSRQFGVTVNVQYGSSKEFHYAQVSLGAHRGSWQGTAHQSFDQGHCAGVTHVIDYHAHRVRFSFRDTCLGSPRWIRVQVLAVAQEARGLYDVDYVPRQHGRVGRYGQRVHRG